jgi:hypothetical protein
MSTRIARPYHELGEFGEVCWQRGDGVETQVEPAQSGGFLHHAAERNPQWLQVAQAVAREPHRRRRDLAAAASTVLAPVAVGEVLVQLVAQLWWESQVSGTRAFGEVWRKIGGRALTGRAAERGASISAQ